MAKKHKLSHAEREAAAMLRNSLKRAERVTNAQERNAAHYVEQQARVDAEIADREAAINKLEPKAQELVRKQANVMHTSRGRFNTLLTVASLAAMSVPGR